MNYRAASHAVSKALQAWMRGKPRVFDPKQNKNDGGSPALSSMTHQTAERSAVFVFQAG